MSQPSEPAAIIIRGRPDFENGQFSKFGVTRAKRHPKYVYGNAQGLLLHEVAYVELHWYDIGEGGHSLIRRASPRMTILTRCGQMFHTEYWQKKRKDGPRSTMCELPKHDAVLCGRCRGEGPVFGKNSKGNVTKKQARARLGCEDVIQLSGDE